MVDGGGSDRRSLPRLRGGAGGGRSTMLGGFVKALEGARSGADGAKSGGGDYRSSPKFRSGGGGASLLPANKRGKAAGSSGNAIARSNGLSSVEMKAGGMEDSQLEEGNDCMADENVMHDTIHVPMEEGKAPTESSLREEEMLEAGDCFFGMEGVVSGGANDVDMYVEAPVGGGSDVPTQVKGSGLCAGAVMAT